MPDFILRISFDDSDGRLEDLIQSVLFLRASSGSTLSEEGGRATIEAYFDSAASRDDARRDLERPGLETASIDRERVDWLDRYEQSLQAIEIGSRFVVAPDADLFDDASDRLRLVVPQEQAFGTGSHETTALCIALLETLDVRGSRALDIGAGSGILALAAQRLGARKVIAFDNDLDAYGALRDNRMRNEVPEARMSIFIGGVEALRGGSFDILTMNIIPEVIIPLLGSVVTRMTVGASLVLSGILTTRRDDVVSAADAEALILREERGRGEWWAGVFQRRR